MGNSVYILFFCISIATAKPSLLVFCNFELFLLWFARHQWLPFAWCATDDAIGSLWFLSGFLAGLLAGLLAGFLAGFLKMSYCVSRDIDDCLTLGWLPWWATNNATGSLWSLAGFLAGFLRMSYCVSRDVDDCLSLGWLPWWATDDATGSDLQISQATICRVPQPKKSQWGQIIYGGAFFYAFSFMYIYVSKQGLLKLLVVVDLYTNSLTIG